jgi:predicted nucleic acid-binding protein
MAAPYIDTIALAKWYLNEASSEDFEAYIRRQEAASISRLTALEFRCLLARRRRLGEIDSRTESRVWAAFEGDIREGFLEVHPLDDGHALDAMGLVGRLRSHPLRSLDALHLAIARSLGAGQIATADRSLAHAAVALGMKVARFD